MDKNTEPYDGATAAAHIAYAMSDAAYIVRPSKKKKNILPFARLTL
jgi:hypothetical protein